MAWNPYGVALELSATAGTVTRTSATQYTVIINASWEVQYSGANTYYGMRVTSGGKTTTITSFNTNGNEQGSGTLTGTYSISGNGAATKTISVTFTNFNDMGASKSTSINLSVSVPAWTSYKITYNANGGSGAPSSQTKWKDQSLTLSASKPTRAGYSFLGWSSSTSATTATYAAGASFTTNATTTLYAVWKANTYTVIFNANGGTGAPSSQTKIYNVALKLSSTKPTRTNYEFLGWSSSASATTATYTAGGNYTSNIGVTLYAVWKLAYTKPRIENFNVFRCNSTTGEPDDSGTAFSCHFDWATDRTIESAVLSWTPANENAQTQVILTSELASGTNGIYDGSAIRSGFTTETTYTFVITITDDSGFNTASATLPGTKFTVDFKAGGNGVAFGKPAEMEDYADFGYEVCLNNKLRISGRDLQGNIVEAFQPVNENGNTVIGWGNYDKRSGNTNVYGHDVILGVSNITNPDTFRPYRRQGDSIDITLRAAGYVTNAGKQVDFWIPMSVPIIGFPTVTVTSRNGFTLRQGEKYTHGSSASVSVSPNSYTVTRTTYNGIHVQANFTDTTNVTNNDAIGIHWNGTITFS